MTIDVLDRLRSANPCPADLIYPENVAEHNIRLIVGVDVAAESVGTDDRPEPVPLLPTVLRRRHQRWVLGSATVVVVAAAVAAALLLVPSDPSAPERGASWVRYQDRISASFDHPANWSEYHAPFQGHIVSVEVWLSSVPFPDPCSSSSAPNGVVSEGCNPPAPNLRGGGVFVEWTSGNLPSNSDLVPSPTGTIGGYEAEVQRSAPVDNCATVGAVAEVSAVIAYPSHSQTTRMNACIGAGDVDADYADIDRMLASVTFAPM